MKASGRWTALPTASIFVASYAVLGLGWHLWPIGAWYAQLAKPAWAPPALWIGAAGLVLHGLLAIAVNAAWHLPLRSGLHPVVTSKGPLETVFVAILGLHLAWSMLFFGTHELMLALGAIVVMTGLAALLAVMVDRRTHLGALMTAPYLVWLGVLTATNGAVVMLR